MRLTRWLHPVIVLVLLGITGPYAAAQDKLPAKLAGKWNGTFPGKGTPFGGTWSIVIDKQNPDGTIEGKAIWGGGQYCLMDNEPFTGKFDGAELTIVAQWRDKIPNANCGKANMVLKKKGNDFEGRIPGSRYNYQLTLSPS